MIEVQMQALTVRPTFFNFRELSEAPNAYGLYAWYFKPRWLDKDINDLVGKLANPEYKSIEKEEAVETFLYQRYFSLFSLPSYDVSISGSLRPDFKGVINHDQGSDELVKRIVKDPSRLFEIRAAFNDFFPFFSAPIYVGLARKQTLRKRLGQHRDRIIDLFERGSNADILPEELEDEEFNSSFAKQVFYRGYDRNELVVAAWPVGEHVALDLENLINRTLFPILGKN